MLDQSLALYSQPTSVKFAWMVNDMSKYTTDATDAVRTEVDDESGAVFYDCEPEEIEFADACERPPGPTSGPTRSVLRSVTCKDLAGYLVIDTASEKQVAGADCLARHVEILSDADRIVRYRPEMATFQFGASLATSVTMSPQGWSVGSSNFAHQRSLRLSRSWGRNKR